MSRIIVKAHGNDSMLMIQRELETEEIRSLAFNALKNFVDNKTCSGYGSITQQTLINEIECIAATRGLISTPSGGRATDARVSENEFIKIQEVISSLMT